MNANQAVTTDAIKTRNAGFSRLPTKVGVPFLESAMPGTLRPLYDPIKAWGRLGGKKRFQSVTIRPGVNDPLHFGPRRMAQVGRLFDSMAESRREYFDDKVN